MPEPAPAVLPDIGKIAVLRPNAVGDFIFSLPALHALKSAYPEAEIVFLGKPWHARFLAGRPAPVDRVLVVPPCPGIGAPPDAEMDPEPRRRFVEAMRAEEFDIAIQLYGGGRYSNPLVKEWGAGLTVGMRAAGTAALDRWIAFELVQNRRLQMLEVVSLIGANSLRLGQELAVTESDRREAARILPSGDAQPLVVLQPGATDVRRHWPAERFAAVGDALASRGARVAINGSEAEAAIVRRVVAAMRHPAVDLSGRLSLGGLCGLLERAALLVANDTGPLHLGLAIGTPAVGIYWLSNLTEACPLRQHRHRAALAVRTNCPVCGEENLKTRCPHDVSFVAEVSAEEVTELALALYAG